MLNDFGWQLAGNDRPETIGALGVVEFEALIDLVAGKRIAIVFGMSGLATAFAFAAVLGFILGIFDNIAGGRLGRIGGVFLGGSKFRLQLRNSRLKLFKLLFPSGASCARVRPCGGHNAIRYSIAENATSQTGTV